MNKILLFILSTFVLFQASAQDWDQKAKVVASDRTTNVYFGNSVAVSGTYAIVGAYGERKDVTGGNTLALAGAAYFYERNASGQWIEVQKVVPAIRSQEEFGRTVAISGNYALIGAYVNSKDTAGLDSLSFAGAAYVFERDSAGSWNEVQKIVPADRGYRDFFGWTLSIDGDRLIIGSYFEDHNLNGLDSLNDAGAAYIFERDGSGIWHQAQKLLASDRSIEDQFGSSVAISGDYALVGARFEDHTPVGIDSLQDPGSAYLFKRDAGGNWLEEQKIVASDRTLADNFGSAVSLSGDRAIVGAFQNDEDSTGINNNAGAAYVFEKDGSGQWNEVQKIVSSDRAPYDQFAVTVCIHNDHIIVGASLEDENITGGDTMQSAGSAYIFKRDSLGNWTQIQKIVPDDRAMYDQFGLSVSLNGNYAIVGAWAEDEDATGGNKMVFAGSAYLFEQPCSINDSVTISGGSTLKAYDSLASYQWLDCIANFALISGETAQEFVPLVSGDYAVEISKTGCKDTSLCHSILIGIVESDFESNLVVFPNPTTGRFYIDLGKSYSDVKLMIRNMSGQVIRTKNFETAQKLDVQIEGASAYYMIEIATGEGKSANVKVFKE